MLTFLDPLREMTFLSVTVRLVIALLCGGAIGFEREVHRRPAGFRTHIMISIGAALVSLTSEFLLRYMNLPLDVGRMGANIVAGMGFIGAGAIIVIQGKRIQGLTTAAGLWVAAIIGLAVGGGFIEGGILVTLFVLFAEIVLIKAEYKIFDKTQAMRDSLNSGDSGEKPTDSKPNQ